MKRHPMRGARHCVAGPEEWRVSVRDGNYSAFNGYAFQPSDYSQVICITCHSVWRSKAKYVRGLPDITQQEREKWLKGP